MPAEIVTGHVPAAALLARTAERAQAFAARKGRPPGLAIVISEAHPGSLAYAARQAEFGQSAGVTVIQDRFKEAPDARTLEAHLVSLNANDFIDGILLLAPVPAPLDLVTVAQAIAPAKDVEGLTAFNAGRTALGLPGIVPCTAEGAVALAESIVGELKGRDVAVIGASAIVGRPLAQLLLRKEATVTVCHIATKDAAKLAKRAELVFVAAGKAGLVTSRWIARGAVVIDIGINPVPGKPGRLVGDADLASVRRVARAISAVPDGVGPLTTAYLMAHTVDAAFARAPG